MFHNPVFWRRAQPPFWAACFVGLTDGVGRTLARLAIEPGFLESSSFINAQRRSLLLHALVMGDGFDLLIRQPENGGPGLASIFSGALK